MKRMGGRAPKLTFPKLRFIDEQWDKGDKDSLARLLGISKRTLYDAKKRIRGYAGCP